MLVVMYVILDGIILKLSKLIGILGVVHKLRHAILDIFCLTLFITEPLILLLQNPESGNINSSELTISEESVYFRFKQMTLQTDSQGTPSILKGDPASYNFFSYLRTFSVP
jgi:hypothetical protein